jgi:hypothetical protein
VIAEELDDVIVAGRVARLWHEERIAAARVVFMSARAAAISGLAVGVLVLFVAWLFDVSVSHVTLLAPVVVLVAAAVAGLGVFWFRAAADSLRESRHPRLIIGVATAIVALGVVLTVLGVELPRE